MTGSFGVLTPDPCDREMTGEMTREMTDTICGLAGGVRAGKTGAQLRPKSLSMSLSFSST
ncbi:hypothetical protein SAMN04515647_2274 [Cohaesibacter sp. ES.047]|nr:hypothetical protein SAMN04515647_2274 [Cohaesibacter sp. ES.047]